MTWDAYHRRKETLHEILAIADRETDRSLTELLDVVDPERHGLDDETAALFEIQMTWFQHLSAQLDRLALEGRETPQLVAASAWTATAAELPGARALLDDHQEAPELATAFAKERAFIAASAGIRADPVDLRTQGTRIIDVARAGSTGAGSLGAGSLGAGSLGADIAPPAAGSPRRSERPGLIARLRNAIAA